MPPLPPRNLVMPHVPELLFLAISLLLVLVLLVLGIRDLLRRRDATVLVLLIAGAFAGLLEPVVDVNGLMYLPEKGAIRAFTLYDRAMPLFVITAYSGYFAVLAYVAYRVLSTRPTISRVLQMYAGMVVFNVAFETPAVLLGVYSYYGDQPLDFWGFPLWWGIVNPLASIFVATFIVATRGRLRSAVRLAAIVPLLPLSDGAANGAAASPMWLALNSGLGMGWKYVAAGITAVIAFCLVRGMAWLNLILTQPSTYAIKTRQIAASERPPDHAHGPRHEPGAADISGPSVQQNLTETQ